jgi:perosamine synthetase
MCLLRAITGPEQPVRQISWPGMIRRSQGYKSLSRNIREYVMDVIPVSRPSLGDAELAAVREVFDSCWLGLGAQVFAFEQELSRFLGAQNVVCTNTGTTALHLALDALGIGSGDEVVVPSLTFVATIQAITATGARPVFCDVHDGDLNMDVGDAAKRITPQTKAILPVHYRGFPCDMGALQDLACDRDLFIVEDAAHAFGSSYRGKKIGSFPTIACLSFDPIKNITCGEGGAIAFADPELLPILQQKRILGIDKDTWSRYRNERSWFYDVVTQGYRYHMPNINAAIGLVQLKKFARMNEDKIRVARAYDDAFRDCPGITLLENHGYREIGLFAYILRVQAGRNEMMDFLGTKGVGSGVHYIPSHQFTFYREDGRDLPVTERVYNEILTLPLFAGMTSAQVDRVIAAVQEWCGKA